MLAIIVTPMPSTSETMTVRRFEDEAGRRQSRSEASKTAFRPLASPSPANRPTTEASTPMHEPSISTERRTCRRDAPSERRVANSRTRWATVIEMVLKMTKEPTKTAIAGEGEQEVADDARGPR